MYTEQVSVKNRSRSEINHEILQMLEKEPQKRTNLFYTLKTSYPALRQYEAWLVEHGLIKVSETTYTITEKGKQYLKALNNAENILRKESDA